MVALFMMILQVASVPAGGGHYASAMSASCGRKTPPIGHGR